MRIICALFFLVIATSVRSQSQKDTINLLFNLSKKYFETMYVNKKFDSASQFWDKRMLGKLKEIYRKDNIAPNDSLVMTRIKAAYCTHFKTISKFSFYMFGYHRSNSNLEPLEVMLSFYYNTNEGGKKSKKKSTALFFRPLKGSNWEIYDFIALDIAKQYN